MKNENRSQKADDTKQMSLNEKLDALETKIKEGFKGKIIHVIEMTNDEYFGGGGTYTTKDGMKIVVLVENDETFDCWYSIPSWRGYEKSNIYAFKEKYGKYPEKDLDIFVVIGDNGFYAIEL